jgi:hypothetical protein
VLQPSSPSCVDRFTPQSGVWEAHPSAVDVVKRRIPVPSAFMTKSASRPTGHSADSPSTVRVKTIHCPSGDHAGKNAPEDPWVSCRRSVPSGRTVKTCGTNEGTGRAGQTASTRRLERRRHSAAVAGAQVNWR